MTTINPATVWRPTDGHSEMGQSGSDDITTLSGLSIITLGDDNLIVAPGTTTRIPDTIWVEIPPEVVDRITEDGDTRITEDGNTRILEQLEE